MKKEYIIPSITINRFDIENIVTDSAQILTAQQIVTKNMTTDYTDISASNIFAFDWDSMN